MISDSPTAQICAISVSVVSKLDKDGHSRIRTNIKKQTIKESGPWPHGDPDPSSQGTPALLGSSSTTSWPSSFHRPNSPNIVGLFCIYIALSLPPRLSDIHISSYSYIYLHICRLTLLFRLICGFPNTGKSSFLKSISRADVVC